MSRSPVVVGLHVARASRLPIIDVEHVDVEGGVGIVGDRYHGSRHRHVTVQSLEEIEEAAAELERQLDPALTRRNVTVSHGRLARTPGTRMRIGSVELEVVRDAAPCKLLEDGLGRDAKQALHRRAGVVYRALTGGRIWLGDALEPGSDPPR